MVSESFRVDASAASGRRPDGYRRSPSFLVDVLRFPAGPADPCLRDAGLRPGEACSFDSEGDLADQASAFCGREVDFCVREPGFCPRDVDSCPRDVDSCGLRTLLPGRLPDGFEVRSVTVLVLNVVSVLSL